ncbi:Rv0361 family membrane protein [Tomitella biformata]|uniref:Rv0361 family membrane protein n=1 Tax=Tomitella biformata TaxID=630403 RepID=UPI0004660B64|nr:hypothetical protein [Tomitella biformata]
MRHRPHAATVKTTGATLALALAAVLLTSCSAADGSGSDSAEGQIKQVTQDYITAVNMGRMTEVSTLICSRLASTVQGGGEDLPESAKKAQINSFDAITVNGDSATAHVTVSVIDDAATPAQSVEMLFVNEDGWKLCQ